MKFVVIYQEREGGEERGVSEPGGEEVVEQQEQSVLS